MWNVLRRDRENNVAYIVSSPDLHGLSSRRITDQATVAERFARHRARRVSLGVCRFPNIPKHDMYDLGVRLIHMPSIGRHTSL